MISISPLASCAVGSYSLQKREASDYSKGVMQLTMTELLPADVMQCLNRHELNHRPVLLTTDSDISLTGEDRRNWLIVTADHLTVVAEDRSSGRVALTKKADRTATNSHESGDIQRSNSRHDAAEFDSGRLNKGTETRLKGTAEVVKEPASETRGTLGAAASAEEAFADNASLVRAVPVTQIKAVRTWSGLGSGILQVRTEEAWVDLVRYSNAHAERFHKVSRKLDVFCTGGELTIHPDEKLDAHRCPTCQLRLSTAAETCPRCVHKSQVLSRVWDILKPQLNWSILLCVLTIVGVAAELVPPKLQQHLVDNVLGERAIDEPRTNFLTALLLVVLALAGSRVILSVVGVFKGRLATQIGSSLTHRLRGEMVHKLQKLAIAYYDRHQVGSLMSRVAYDSEVLHGLVHQLTGGFLLQILQLVGVGGMLIWLNPRLAFYTLIPVPLVFLGTWYFWHHVYPRYYRLWDSSSKQIAALSGMLSGIRVVKAFAQENREFDRFQRSSTYMRDSKLWVENATSVYSATMQLVFSLGGLIVWYVGGRDVIGREMTLGSLIAFLAYLAMFYAPLATLSNFTTWLTSFLTGSKRVLELLDTPLTIAEPDSPEKWADVKGAIQFENVTFGYDRHQPVLQNVSFEVQPGEMVGIVGRSGSGKTTLVNLLGRFYDVQEGRILVDGHDLKNVSLESLRKNLGIVFQESFLFRGNIWDNLSYGRPSTTLEEGLAAAKAAGAHDFICRASLGYETLLGEHGAGLSGGEKQRLSIARTLLYDPKILVLDEATSSIDAEAERAIQQALEVLVKGRTTIAIAHRLSTLRNADRIIVFDRGRLIEQGSHAELLQSDGVYARLVKIQTQISKDPSVDKLVVHQNAVAETAVESASPDATTKAVEEPATSVNPRKHEIVWLSPANCHIRLGEFSELLVDRTDLETASCAVDPPLRRRDLADSANTEAPKPQLRGAFVVCTFPASRPEEYLSLRAWDENGDETEIGMIRSLDEWPEDVRDLIRAAIRRRYLLRRIESIHRMELAHGYLECDVQTDRGREKFTMRWSQSQAQDFGDGGKLIIDTEDNRYVIPDVEELPKSDRTKFRQHIYW
jgi:ATP-binding cassette subfamily B protein